MHTLKKAIISTNINSGETAINKAAESLRETVYRLCELDTILELENSPSPTVLFILYYCIYSSVITSRVTQEKTYKKE